MLATIVLVAAILSVVLPLIAAFAPTLFGAGLRKKLVAAFKRLSNRKVALFVATILSSAGSSILGSIVHSWSIGVEADQTGAMLFALIFIASGATIIIVKED
jgi:hypothetical protein